MHDATFFERRGAILNRAVLVLMPAGAAASYALASIAEGLADPRWRLLLLLAALVPALLSALLFYARFVEPGWIRITRRRVSFPVDGLRIAVIGDFHVGPHKRDRFVHSVARRANALRPDLVLLVGDFLYDHRADVEHLEPLRHLHARLGVFAVVGNHDSGRHHTPSGVHEQHGDDRTDDLVTALEPLGIRFVRNVSVRVGHDDKSFSIAGIDDVWMDSCDLRAALKSVSPDEPCILLSHQPDVLLDPLSHRAQLIVSGHTHGGQVRLPIVGSLSRLPQRLNKSFDRGIFAIGERTTLAITHGIGETFLPLRLFARPEILLLETV